MTTAHNQSPICCFQRLENGGTKVSFLTQSHDPRPTSHRSHPRPSQPSSDGVFTHVKRKSDLFIRLPLSSFRPRVSRSLFGPLNEIGTKREVRGEEEKTRGKSSLTTAEELTTAYSLLENNATCGHGSEGDCGWMLERWGKKWGRKRGKKSLCGMFAGGREREN